MLPYRETIGLNHKYIWVLHQHNTLHRYHWAEPWVHVSITLACYINQKLSGWNISTFEYHSSILPYKETIELNHEYMWVSHQYVTLHRDYLAEPWVHMSITPPCYLIQSLLGCMYHEYMYISPEHVTLHRDHCAELRVHMAYLSLQHVLGWCMSTCSITENMIITKTS